MADSSPDTATGIVTRLQRFSLHDGPGIRTTVFLKGCPLSCPWCHNPETRFQEPEVWTNETRCIRCGACLDICPVNRMPRSVPADGNPAGCTVCGLCASVCPTGARDVVGTVMNSEELVRRAIRDVPFFEYSGGGITFSGGEPLQQFDFLMDVLVRCRTHGVHTAVDTCGYAPADAMEQVARNTDLFLFDLKTGNAGLHQETIGVPLNPILENLALLDDSGTEIWIRIPLIPGFNDSADDLEAIARIIQGMRRSPPVYLLPYHQTGIMKARRLGQHEWECEHGCGTETIRRAVETLQSFGFVLHGGTKI